MLVVAPESAARRGTAKQGRWRKRVLYAFLRAAYVSKDCIALKLPGSVEVLAPGKFEQQTIARFGRVLFEYRLCNIAGGDDAMRQEGATPSGSAVQIIASAVIGARIDIGQACKDFVELDGDNGQAQGLQRWRSDLFSSSAQCKYGITAPERK